MIAMTPDRLPDRAPDRAFNPFLIVALFCLALAASTGVLLRFGLIYGMPAWAQNYTAVRHAHSHLMYFGWVTLALMALIWEAVGRYTGRPLPRLVRWQMAATALAALLSYPAFWQNGYGLTQVGSAHLPLGAMVSTLNGLTWFWFVGLYWRGTRGLHPHPLPVQMFDWAILLMLLAGLGAVGLVGMVVARSDNAFLQQLFLHQFLDLFAVGWFNLALLGVLWAGVEQSKTPSFFEKLGVSAGVSADPMPLPRWLPTMSLALLLAPTFVLGITPGLLPAHLFWIAAAANAGAAGLLAVHLVQYTRLHTRLAGRPSSGKTPFREDGLPGSLLAYLGLGALAVVLLIALLLLVPGVWETSAGGPLRIFYLHDLLLGWVSTLLIAGIGPRFIRGGAWRAVAALWTLGVAVMLAALLLFGLAGRVPFPPAAALHLAAWASVPVALAAIGLLAAALTGRQPAPAPPAPAQAAPGEAG